MAKLVLRDSSSVTDRKYRGPISRAPEDGSTVAALADGRLSPFTIVLWRLGATLRADILWLSYRLDLRQRTQPVTLSNLRDLTSKWLHRVRSDSAARSQSVAR